MVSTFMYNLKNRLSHFCFLGKNKLLKTIIFTENRKAATVTINFVVAQLTKCLSINHF